MSLPSGISRPAVDLLHRMIDLGGLYACECSRAEKRAVIRMHREGWVDLEDPQYPQFWRFAWPTPKGRTFAKGNP